MSILITMLILLIFSGKSKDTESSSPIQMGEPSTDALEKQKRVRQGIGNSVHT